VALVIYTKPGCPYCQQARDHYNSKGIAFIDRDAQTKREYRAEMFKFSNADPTEYLWRPCEDPDDLSGCQLAMTPVSGPKH